MVSEGITSDDYNEIKALSQQVVASGGQKPANEISQAFQQAFDAAKKEQDEKKD